MKTIYTADLALESFNKNDDPTYLKLGWNGTDICGGFGCECGYEGHIDSDFVYLIECPNCKSIYALNPHIELIKIIKPLTDNDHIPKTPF